LGRRLALIHSGIKPFIQPLTDLNIQPCYDGASIETGDSMSQEKIILLSNDDGYFAEGLQALKAAMSRLGRVIVVAPDTDCSGISHKISIHTPLRIREVEEDWYAVNGSPVDCVHMGIHALLQSKTPDLFVSGINHGVNLGEDTAYSGTVSAAYEAYTHGVASIAVSAGRRKGQFNFEDAAEFAAQFGDQLLQDRDLAHRAVWNLNVPPRPIQGVRIVRLDKRTFTSSVIERIDPRGQKYYWIGPYYPQFDHGQDTDYRSYKSGHIAITPLKVEMTDFEALDQVDATRFQGLMKPHDS